MAEFEIKVTELDEGGKDYAFPIRAAWLAEELERLGDAAFGLTAPASDGAVTLFADKTGPDVIVRGRVRGELVAICSRCLGPAPVPIDAEMALLLSARSAKGRGHRPDVDEEDLSPEEMEREFYTGDTIVLDDVVREHILVEVPMQPLCKESCPGIAVPPAIKGPDIPEPVGKNVMARAFERAEQPGPPKANGHPPAKMKRAR